MSPTTILPNFEQPGGLRKLSKRGKVSLPEMVRIPAGNFIMGTSDDSIQHLYIKEDWVMDWFDADLFMSEQPQHEVGLPAYMIGKFPVTNEEYHQFIWDTAHRLPRGWSGFSFPEGKERHPVVGISLDDVMAYCKWLSETAKIEFRLPSEAEWERAARWVDGRMYPWGNVFDPWRCNTLESGFNNTTPVGIYSTSGDSRDECADMIGNVWEWTASQHLPYPYKPNTGREELSKDHKFVVRGGAWYYSRKMARCTAREGVAPNYMSPALGFRLARTIEQNP
jgi:formylglycine-generating enzyme required for sulfatase activity